MRHRVRKKALGKTTAHRIAMFRNMVTSLIEHERVKTTLPKAKQLRAYADKMITLGKKASLHSRRQALSFIRDRVNVDKLFSDLAPRFTGRPGGYTRIYKAGFRAGDKAPMAIIEFIDAKLSPKSDETPDKAIEKTVEKAAVTPREVVSE